MIFISNKYTRWYYAIISRAQTRTLEIYTEKHHIVPKSLGGTNTMNNLVKLSAREHFICHLLLTKMTSGKDRYRMLQAAEAFTKWASSKHQRTVKVNSRLFELLKIQKSRALKDLWATDSGYRTQALSGLTKLVNNLEHQTKMSTRRKELWKDATYKVKMSQRPPQPSKKVMVCGVEYQSLAEVSVAFGITTNNVCKRCLSNSATFSDWYYI